MNPEEIPDINFENGSLRFAEKNHKKSECIKTIYWVSRILG